MKHLPIVMSVTVLLASAAFAHQGVKDAKVKSWMHTMGQIGQASKSLGDMARGKTAFHEAAAAEARDQLIDLSKDIPGLFSEKAFDPVSEALPAIWENFDDFSDRADAMRLAAEGLDPTSVETLQSGMRSLGRSCGGCHKSYRK